MNIFNRKVSVLLIALASILAPTPHSYASNDEAFLSLSGGFTIELTKRTGGGAFNNSREFYFNDGGLDFKIGFIPIDGHETPQTFTFDRWVKEFEFKGFSQSRLAKITSRNVKLSNYQGREYKYNLQSKTAITRIFLIENIVYKLHVKIPVGNQSLLSFADGKFDSFRIMDKKIVANLIKERVSEATPKALRQSPVLKRATNDLQDQDIRGSVKSITTYISSFGSNHLAHKRAISSYEEYSREGNIVKSIIYNAFGNPGSITVFGYEDGRRVSKTGNVSYGDEVEPGAVFLGSGSRAAAKFHETYDSYYIFKYRGNDLIEKETVTDVGSRRIQYSRRGNLREETFLNRSGKPFSKTSMQINRVSGENWMTYQYLGTDSPEKPKMWRYYYAEIDSESNWTQRVVDFTEFVFDTKTGGPRSIEYRDIVYYE